MVRVVVIGSGVVGAAIAYELTEIEGWEVTLMDSQQPAQGATGAALGILMGAISQKTKGRNWKLRHQSLQRVKTLLPELEHLNGEPVDHNRHGLVMLELDRENLPRWERLQAIRDRQGYRLELWDRTELHQRLPYVDAPDIAGAIYSPDDCQINPLSFTQSLIKAGQKRGLICRFDEAVTSITPEHHCSIIETPHQTYQADWVIITAGLGSNLLSQVIDFPLHLQPVLGQAIALGLPQPLGDQSFRPVITGKDIHLVPQLLQPHHYWIGATVEFPATAGTIPIADGSLLEEVKAQAYRYCSALKAGEILFQWQGYRPRPEGRPAPIIELLPRSHKTIIATGHYRNGVLLAPSTGLQVKQMILDHLQMDRP